jgi:hypothetical protein
MFVKVMEFSKLAVLLMGLSFCLAGCSSGPPKPEIGSLKGKVTLDGAPFTGGQVTFRGRVTGIGTTAELKPDGTFEVITPEGGLRVDTYEVAVTPPPPPPLDPIASAAGTAPPPEASKIPEKFRDFATSEFTVKIEKGANEANFDMKSQ